ncbi:MAG: zinc ribbon domain-containing protein [Bacilli bacterium]|nr:zinc ribbon domain-containing protein [Bacilli bacterium]
MNKICDNCGSIVKPEAKVCPQCGAFITAIPQKVQNNDIILAKVQRASKRDRNWTIVGILFLIYAISVLSYTAIIAESVRTVYRLQSWSSLGISPEKRDIFIFLACVPGSISGLVCLIISSMNFKKSISLEKSCMWFCISQSLCTIYYCFFKPDTITLISFIIVAIGFVALAEWFKQTEDTSNCGPFYCIIIVSLLAVVHSAINMISASFIEYFFSFLSSLVMFGCSLLCMELKKNLYRARKVIR